MRRLTPSFLLSIFEFISQPVEAFAPALLHPGKRGEDLRSQLEILSDEPSMQRQFRDAR